ncbi:M23 family metallopeptidase [Saccharopolyspora sp. NPDC000359]|uniref:M23 family metallopeptidase n=1 Tax=Saccharopolyspora sp. NPDC000359 TaxID=3154251 RepID=UPI00331D59BB
MAIRERTALGGLAVLFTASLACASADLSAAFAPPRAAAVPAAEFAAPRPEPAQQWVAPTEGEISSGFGERWGTTHEGVDVANEVGTPVRAASSGVVIDFGPASGYGLWIRIEHPHDIISTYGHIDAGFASVGQSVRTGEVIATMGDRGHSTGPHLHFQIDVAGVPVDPVRFYAERSAELVG